jgi:hypothetical protein
VKPQILVEHDCYLESNFGCSRNESQRMLLRYSEC